MRGSRSLLLILLFTSAIGSPAQPPNSDCAGAVNLCADQPTAGNNTGANGVLPTLCPPGGNLLWYTFTTNSEGGAVNVDITGIDCLNTAGMDNELSVRVLTFGVPCDPATYNVIGNCEQDSNDFTVTVPGLAPNTQYWIIVAGMMDNGATLVANCDFSIMTSGPGADIVGVDFSAGPDVLLTEGSNTQLLATGGTTYDWSPTSGLSGNGIPDPFAQPEETTLYTVTTQINGCSYTDDVLVQVTRLISPPNTITPNGDGQNDTWEIFGINDYLQADVKIFDRWGQRVFQSVGYKEPFDGGGLPTGTYYWVIDLNILEGTSDPYTGFLTIVN